MPQLIASHRKVPKNKKPPLRNSRAQSRARSASRTTLPRRSTLRVMMMRKHEWLNDAVLRQAGERGYSFVTPAMARMFAHMSERPMTLSEIARKLAITRQSLQETVVAAVAAGLIALGKDPSDRRVRILCYTDAGRRMSQSALAADRKVERGLERRIGKRNIAALKRILAMEW